VGNVSLAVALISFIYMVLFYTGGPVMADGSRMVAPSDYLALACLGYFVLTFEVCLAFHGKLKPHVVAWSLLLWVPIGLWVPGFWLMTTGRLPF
jgi:hypothetical protein